MTDIERLKTTKDYLREQYQEDIKKCKYPELKDVIKQTYEENKKAFSTAIKAIEENNELKAEIERLKVQNEHLLKLWRETQKDCDNLVKETVGDAE